MFRRILNQGRKDLALDLEIKAESYPRGRSQEPLRDQLLLKPMLRAQL